MRNRTKIKIVEEVERKLSLEDIDSMIVKAETDEADALAVAASIDDVIAERSAEVQRLQAIKTEIQNKLPPIEEEDPLNGLPRDVDLRDNRNNRPRNDRPRNNRPNRR